MAKEEHIPSRRTGKTSLGAKVFSYYTQEERRLLEKAAKLERRSLSSFAPSQRSTERKGSLPASKRPHKRPLNSPTHNAAIMQY